MPPVGNPPTGISDSVRFVSCVRAGEAKLREGVRGEGSLNAGPPGPKFPRVPGPFEAHFARENTYGLVKNTFLFGPAALKTCENT